MNMPTYSYKCSNPDCDNTVEHIASMTSFKEEHPSCTDCGSICNYTFVPSVPYVSFIDGPSGSWPSKGERFKKYRAKAAEAASIKQRDRYGEVKGAVPNFNGVEYGSWQEAKEVAVKEKGVESGATFDSKIKEEKSK